MEELVPFDESILRRMGHFHFLPAVKITLKNKPSIKRKEKFIKVKNLRNKCVEIGYTDMKHNV